MWLKWGKCNAKLSENPGVILGMRFCKIPKQLKNMCPRLPASLP